MTVGHAHIDNHLSDAGDSAHLLELLVIAEPRPPPRRLAPGSLQHINGQSREGCPCGACVCAGKKAGGRACGCKSGLLREGERERKAERQGRGRRASMPTDGGDHGQHNVVGASELEEEDNASDGCPEHRRQRGSCACIQPSMNPSISIGMRHRDGRPRRETRLAGLASSMPGRRQHARRESASLYQLVVACQFTAAPIAAPLGPTRSHAMLMLHVGQNRPPRRPK